MYLQNFSVVEAAGVEPASETDQLRTSTCVAPSVDLAGRPPMGQVWASGQPVEFRLPVPGGPSGYPAVRRPAGSPREKDPVDGLLKQPAATVSWRLVFFHLINEGVGLGTQSQPQQSRRIRFAPTRVKAAT